jgi:hypothetical protein
MSTFRQRRGRGIAAAALITLGMTAATASAATAPLQAPSSGATHALNATQVAFSLPSRFVASRSISTNAVIRGAYDHVVKTTSPACTVRLDAIGTLQRSAPRALEVARYWGAQRLNIIDSGASDGLRWYIGKAGSYRIAYAYASAPKALATASRRFIVYKMRLATPTPGNASRCDGAVTTDRAALSTAIRSVHTGAK